jgi:hypothetical protein
MSVSRLNARSPGICDPVTAPSSAHGGAAARGGSDPRGGGSAVTAAPPGWQVPAQPARISGGSRATTIAARTPQRSRVPRDTGTDGR